MQALAHVATLARLAAIAAVLALAGLLASGPSPNGGAVRAAGELPACRYDDILTSPRGYDDWSITLVDTILRVQRTYAPPDLVRVTDLGVPGRGKVRSVMALDLKQMSDAAAAAGAAIGIQSAYRSYDEQKQVFAGWVARLGYDRALEVSARPGHSEHQLGLALDVRSEPGGDPFTGDWATTPAGAWMKAHAWEYGFVSSYPKGKTKKTCYDYEPWHYRYVGRDLAAAIHDSGLTSREYLWANFTTTIVPPPTPRPTAVPATTATPVATPTVEPSPSPSPSLAPSPTAASTTNPTDAPPAPPTAAPALPTAAPGGDGVTLLGSGPLLVGGAAVAIGTIVLGVSLALRRRGRSGVGL